MLLIKDCLNFIYKLIICIIIFKIQHLKKLLSNVYLNIFLIITPLMTSQIDLNFTT